MIYLKNGPNRLLIPPIRIGPSCLKHLDLAHLHRLQRILMALFRNSGAAGSIHNDRHFRQECLCNHGIGDYADIRTQAYECNGFDTSLPFCLLSPDPGPEAGGLTHRFKCTLVNGHLFSLRFNLRMKFPSLGSLDAVGNRKVAAFLGIQVVLAMGVPGYKGYAL